MISAFGVVLMWYFLSVIGYIIPSLIIFQILLFFAGAVWGMVKGRFYA